MENDSTMTAGVDIGDKWSVVCLLNSEGEVVEESRFKSTRKGVSRYFKRPRMRVAMEVGTHSPWMSRAVAELGHEVLVANPGRVRLVHAGGNKSDRVDAEKLARIARMDPKLLSPIKHREEKTQTVRTLLRARDLLVRSRANQVNAVRGFVKTIGYRLPSCSTERFDKMIDQLPEELGWALGPVMGIIRFTTNRIKAYDAQIEQLCEEYFPETQLLTQIAGVGAVTALAFVVTIEDPHRFRSNRLAGAYLGLCPRRKQTGESDPELRITKGGDSYMRRLLVGSAHYIIGPFGLDSDLRRWGMKLADRGGKNAKKRAVVAVARKLSVLLLSLWRSGEVYEPLRNSREQS